MAGERIAYVFAQKSPSTPRRFPVDIVVQRLTKAQRWTKIRDTIAESLAAATARAVRTDDATIGRFIQVYECSYDARAALADHSSGPERFWRNAGPTAGALTPCSAIERAFAKILSQRADIRIGAPLNPPCEKLSVRLDAQTRRALADAASAHDAAGALALARDILEKWFADRIQSESQESVRGTTTRRSFPGIFKEQ